MLIATFALGDSMATLAQVNPIGGETEYHLTVTDLLGKVEPVTQTYTSELEAVNGFAAFLVADEPEAVVAAAAVLRDSPMYRHLP